MSAPFIQPCPPPQGMPAQDATRRPASPAPGKRPRRRIHSHPPGKEAQAETAGHGRVRLEISAEHLCRLLANQQLCAADFRCLDGESRYCVRALCQKNCSRYLLRLWSEAPKLIPATFPASKPTRG